MARASSNSPKPKASAATEAPKVETSVSTAGDATAVVPEGAAASPDWVFQARSHRAPYRRAGVVFGSTTEAIDLPSDLTAEQGKRLVLDPVIRLSMLHVASGQKIELARDLFNEAGEPDLARLDELKAEAERVVAEKGDA